MNGVHVRVPATSANLGPGFDCLGCALSMYAEFDCHAAASGLEITGCPSEYCNEDNLFVRAFRRAEREIGAPHSGLRLHIKTDVPVSRGLGSSATLLAGGVAAANALNGSPLSREKLVELCNELEGHPDNVAPAVLGGMCASLVQDGRPITVRQPVAPNVGFIALIPNFETETRAMRAVLPKQIPFADAVFNASRLAVLLHAFAQGDLALIGVAMDDRLHQPYRKSLIHEYDCAQAAASRAGCAAFCISGSGSTCLAVADVARIEDIAEKIRDGMRGTSCEWQIHPLRIDEAGAVCTPL